MAVDGRGERHKAEFADTMTREPQRSVGPDDAGADTAPALPPDAGAWSDWGAEGNVKHKIDVPEDRKFTGFDAYKKAIELADVVILTTPPGFRPMHFEEAIRQNKHVFMEKPVAVDGPGIRRVLAAAEEAKRKKRNVVVGLQRHYQTVYRKWVEQLQNGAIGDIVASRVYWNMGALWVHPRQPGQTEMHGRLDAALAAVSGVAS